MSSHSKVEVSSHTIKQDTAPQDAMLIVGIQSNQRNDDFLRNLKLTTVESVQEQSRLSLSKSEILLQTLAAQQIND